MELSNKFCIFVTGHLKVKKYVSSGDPANLPFQTRVKSIFARGTKFGDAPTGIVLIINVSLCEVAH